MSSSENGTQHDNGQQDEVREIEPHDMNLEQQAHFDAQCYYASVPPACRFSFSTLNLQDFVFFIGTVAEHANVRVHTTQTRAVEFANTLSRTFSNDTSESQGSTDVAPDIPSNTSVAIPQSIYSAIVDICAAVRTAVYISQNQQDEDDLSLISNRLRSNLPPQQRDVDVASTIPSFIFSELLSPQLLFSEEDDALMQSLHGTSIHEYIKSAAQNFVANNYNASILAERYDQLSHELRIHFPLIWFYTTRDEEPHITQCAILKLRRSVLYTHTIVVTPLLIESLREMWRQIVNDDSDGVRLCNAEFIENNARIQTDWPIFYRDDEEEISRYNVSMIGTDWLGQLPESVSSTLAPVIRSFDRRTRQRYHAASINIAHRDEAAEADLRVHYRLKQVMLYSGPPTETLVTQAWRQVQDHWIEDSSYRRILLISFYNLLSRGYDADFPVVLYNETEERIEDIINPYPFLLTTFSDEEHPLHIRYCVITVVLESENEQLDHLFHTASSSATLLQRPGPSPPETTASPPVLLSRDALDAHQSTQAQFRRNRRLLEIQEDTVLPEDHSSIHSEESTSNTASSSVAVEYNHDNISPRLRQILDDIVTEHTRPMPLSDMEAGYRTNRVHAEASILGNSQASLHSNYSAIEASQSPTSSSSHTSTLSTRSSSTSETARVHPETVQPNNTPIPTIRINHDEQLQMNQQQYNETVEEKVSHLATMAYEMRHDPPAWILNLTDRVIQRVRNICNAVSSYSYLGGTHSSELGNVTNTEKETHSLPIVKYQTVPATNVTRHANGSTRDSSPVTLMALPPLLTTGVSLRRPLPPHNTGSSLPSVPTLPTPPNTSRQLFNSLPTSTLSTHLHPLLSYRSFFAQRNHSATTNSQYRTLQSTRTNTSVRANNPGVQNGDRSSVMHRSVQTNDVSNKTIYPRPPVVHVSVLSSQLESAVTTKTETQTMTIETQWATSEIARSRLKAWKMTAKDDAPSICVRQEQSYADPLLPGLRGQYLSADGNTFFSLPTAFHASIINRDPLTRAPYERPLSLHDPQTLIRFFETMPIGMRKRYFDGDRQIQKIIDKARHDIEYGILPQPCIPSAALQPQRYGFCIFSLADHECQPCFLPWILVLRELFSIETFTTSFTMWYAPAYPRETSVIHRGNLTRNLSQRKMYSRRLLDYYRDAVEEHIFCRPPELLCISTDSVEAPLTEGQHVLLSVYASSTHYVKGYYTICLSEFCTAYSIPRK